ncbi:MAG: hypothetical protein JNL74_04735, partial [Fibrobacteres bacterium]|nr:hypothetical protein [Fibrobacterota bacterium]
MELSTFGPYSKRFLGLSLIPPGHNGAIVSFPLSISLKDGRGVKALMAADTYGWTHLEASPDLRFFTLRYYLSPEHDVYADAEFSVLSDDSFVCSVDLVNNSDKDIEAVLETGLVHEWERPSMTVKTPKPSALIQADEYKSLVSYNSYALDGEPVCVRRMLFASNQRVLEGGIGEWPGDSAKYDFSLKSDIQDASVYIRYSKTGARLQRWRIEIDGKETVAGFVKTADEYGSYTGWNWLEVPLGKLTEGSHSLQLTVLDPENSAFLKEEYERNIYGNLCAADSVNKMDIAFDCYVVASSGACPDLWVTRSAEFPGRLEYSFSEGRALVKDRKLRQNGCFVIGADNPWCNSGSTVADFTANENMQHHLQILKPAGKNSDSIDFLCEPSMKIELEPLHVEKGERRLVYFAVVNGKTIAEADERWRKLRDEGFESIMLRARAAYESVRFRTYDSEFGNSVRHIAAYLLSSLNYPLRIADKVVVGESPAKCAFPVLYTWDAGLTAIGQIEVSEERAKRNISQYLECDRERSGFVQHGTALPTQIYAVWALFQKSGDINVIRSYYDAIKNAALFYCGRHKASSSLRNGNGMINTSDVWYNAIGMDDYPVQVHLVKNNQITHGEFPET